MSYNFFSDDWMLLSKYISNLEIIKSLPPIPSCVVKIIDGLLGDNKFGFPCDWEVSDAIVDTGDSICCW